MISCWHGDTDTLPRLRRHTWDPDVVEVTLPFGVKIDLEDADDPHIQPAVHLTVNGTTELDNTAHQARVRAITPTFIKRLEGQRSRLRGEPGREEPLRAYAEICENWKRGIANRYYEAVFESLPYGATLTYDVQVQTIAGGGTGSAQPPPPGTVWNATYSIRLFEPEFTSNDICAVHADPSLGDEHSWVLSLKSDEQYYHLRLDLLQSVYPKIACPADFREQLQALATTPLPPRNQPLLAANRDDVDIDCVASLKSDPAKRVPLPNVDDHSLWLPCVKIDTPAGSVDISAPPINGQVLPLIDRNKDRILVSFPRLEGETFDQITVTTGFDNPRTSIPVDLTQKKTFRPTRLLLLNYCIQGYNDLFSNPLGPYKPPRTYMQLTLRDEQARYSSRPESRENGDPDGYALTLDGHRYYGVKSQWAFNAGVLGLIAHDAPDELRRLQDDVRAGLLTPANAGFGAHRPPYYQYQTNVNELTRGKEVIRQFLQYTGEGVHTYYPDQRLYEGKDAEVQAYQDAGVRYLVFDRSTVCEKGSPTPKFPNPLDYCLWQDSRTQCRLLLIENDVRNGLVGASDDDAERGKLQLDLRRWFMQLVAPDNGGPQPLLVYGDDADKASGNGWFDGDYDGHRLHLDDKYLAALCWIASHPWVQAVTTDDLASDKPEPFELTAATCPSVDPYGPLKADKYGNAFHFDTWQKVWRDFRACWLDTSLGELSGTLEAQLIAPNWPSKNELYDLAWLYFLMCTHESFWNKEPLEGDLIERVYGVLEPEDFVIAESLQQRNAWVYLNASLWADWASGGGTNEPQLNEGDLIKTITQQGSAGPDGLFWDRDLLPNVILYNRSLLVVMDCNGGCITHIFARVGDRPVSVSGHFKAFQFLDTTRQGDLEPGVNCDGEVFQNTVWTPNHAYVAADVKRAAPTLGRYFDPRRPDDDQPWLYPNNFDEYKFTADGRTAVFTYIPGPLPQPAYDRDTFREDCKRDHALRKAGGPGVVWHDPGIPQFTKRITLDGSALHVAYSDVPAEHVVANELCLDLLTAVTQAEYQSKQVSPDRASILLTGPRGVVATVRLGENCRFTSGALTASISDAVARDGRAAGDYLRLHRVLTDNLQIECQDGGAFDYSIELPTAHA